MISCAISVIPHAAKMVKLALEQRVFVVRKYRETGSLHMVQNEFRIRFPKREVLSKPVILAKACVQISSTWNHERKFSKATNGEI